MRFWIAWQFLTVIPSPRRRMYGAGDLGKATAFFPVVGLVLGLMLFGLDRLLDLFLPPLLLNILLAAALIILTGALHMDGFIDTCDGLAVKSSTADKLRIMSDSRVGGFGVVGGCCLILARVASLLALPPQLRASALMLMPVLGRWGMVYAMSLFPAARMEGMGWAVKQEANWKKLALATAFSLAMAVALLGWWGAAVLAVLCLILWLVSHFLCSRFGGLSGDSYGAIDEFGELSVLILVYIIAELGASGWLVQVT